MIFVNVFIKIAAEYGELVPDHLQAFLFLLLALYRDLLDFSFPEEGTVFRLLASIIFFFIDRFVRHRRYDIFHDRIFILAYSAVDAEFILCGKYQTY